MSACLRLGHKYQMDSVVEEGIAYLRTCYPNNYNSWKKCTPFQPPTYSIGVINIARLIGADDLLPVAFLECCKLGEKVIDGFLREDGGYECLSIPDLKLCMRAQQTLAEARVQAVLRVIDTCPPDDCHESDSEVDSDDSDHDCEIPSRFRRILQNGSAPGLCTPDVFAPLSTLAEHTPGLCTACYKMLNRHFAREKRSIFKRLPTLLGITVAGWRS